ncbi:unnamed protein product [Parnassius mnemosyne]|uniref:FLYWCH-type domain-containing protein n=1 Tax=Parnassius mnemosyne TaxID=213953 RepID=A0AAV1K7N8_9NEOP
MGGNFVFGDKEHTHTPPHYFRNIDGSWCSYSLLLRRGGNILHFNGYTFNQRHKCAGERTTWCCTNYYNTLSCPVKIKTIDTKWPLKKKKLTREQTLEKKREAERRRYERIKNDPIKRQEMKEREHLNYLKKKEKGEGSGSLHLVISGVTSEAYIANDSDDDVIEVVRDEEAPIEILSDGEELEREKSKLATSSYEFHFADLPIGPENATDVFENSKDTLQDPLTNSAIDRETSINVTDCNKTISHGKSPEQKKDEDYNDKEGDDVKGNNTYINVTDPVLNDYDEQPSNQENTQTKPLLSDNISSDNINTPNEGSNDHTNKSEPLS